MVNENFERMRRGEIYRAPDPAMIALQNAAARRYLAVNATEGDDDPGGRNRLLRESLGHWGESFLNPPVRWEYGHHVFIGDACLVNYDCLFMDGADIRIGSHVLLAPRVSLITAGHPLDPDQRYVLDPMTAAFDYGRCLNAPIVIEDNCWIGVGATVLGGVTIGTGTTVAAGAIVTRSLPPRVLAAGNPARVIRQL